MLSGVAYVRKICEARKIPISQLEKDCKFSNGYLNPKKLQKIPYERAVIIAKYLGVGIEAILGIEEEKAPTPDAGDDCKSERANIVKIAGRDGSFQERELTDDQLAALKAIIAQMPDASGDL